LGKVNDSKKYIIIGKCVVFVNKARYFRVLGEKYDCKALIHAKYFVYIWSYVRYKYIEKVIWHAILHSAIHFFKIY
jgi:hypothetical protein